MKRFATEALLAWKNRARRKPLVMRGARQVGKTWLVRDFAATAFESLCEINFEKTPDTAKLFDLRDPGKIVPLLAAQTGVPIEPGRTLLFLDEVQAAPQVLPTLRYFYEEMPALHVIAAGSLLEFALSDHAFSMPVGRIEYFFLDPMTFGEFLCAAGRKPLFDFLRAWHVGEEFPAPLHGECMNELRRFLAVGGLPESAEAFLSANGDFIESERTRQGVLSTYADDFAKYARRVPTERLRKVFASVPRQLGGKFTWAQVDREERSHELGAAMDLLCLARVASKVRRTSGSGLPFGADADPRAFKALFLDVGLASVSCGLRTGDIVGEHDPLLINRGALSEQFVGQELAADRETWEPRELYYWARESASSNAEIDYLGACGGHIYPVEVKSGATGRLKSMHQFLLEKGTDFGLRLNGDAPSWMETDFPASDGSRHRFRLLSLPLYLAGEARRLVAEKM